MSTHTCKVRSVVEKYYRNYRAKLPRDLYKASCIIVVKVGETLDRSVGGPCVFMCLCVFECVEG